MSIPNHSIRVHNTDQRHTAKFEQLDLLFISVGYRVTWVGQADKRKPFFAPILAEGIGLIRADGENLRAAARELIVIIAQARQLRAAVRSKKAAQKSQDNSAAAVI